MELVGVASMLEGFDDILDAMVTNEGWVIGTNVPYASEQEFGTSYQSGTPHLRPGFDRAIAGFDHRVEGAEAVAAELERTAFLIERYTKGYTPVDTGHLRASYTARRR